MNILSVLFQINDRNIDPIHPIVLYRDAIQFTFLSDTFVLLILITLTATGHKCGMYVWFVDVYIGKFDR